MVRYMQKGVVQMDNGLQDLYNLVSMSQYEDVHLLTLSEQCAVLEDRVYEIAKSLPPKMRHIIQDYISTRNDLEVETVKAAMRWAKQHYK